MAILNRNNSVICAILAVREKCAEEDVHFWLYTVLIIYAYLQNET
jgi:hypothetical protein